MEPVVGVNVLPDTVVLVIFAGQNFYYKLARYADFTLTMHEWVRMAEDIGFADCPSDIKSFIGEDCEFPWYEEGSGVPRTTLVCVMYCVHIPDYHSDSSPENWSE